jgi:protein-tyrosine phosphatase
VSRPLTLELVRQADAVFCMTAAHRNAVLELAPGAAAKVVTLDPDDDVTDPIGASLDVYVECARRIREQVRRRLDELGFARPDAASRSE